MPPPDYLTDDQLDVFEKFNPPDRPEGVSQFRAYCNLEGIDAPSAEDVKAAIAERDRRRPEPS